MNRTSDPFSELRMLALHPVRGANYWSRRRVIRMDVSIGAYEEISSADVEGMTDSLLRALPGLIEHRCSIGTRGGFLLRLRRGTYAAHIVEHVAIELQSLAGHESGFGRTRGGDGAAEYIIVFDYCTERVGMRAAELALDVVRHAFAGTLGSVDPLVHELRDLALQPEDAIPQRQVFCGITGGNAQECLSARELLTRRLRMDGGEDGVVFVRPRDLLDDGLGYAHAELAILLDAELHDVPERFRDRGRAVKLVTVLADVVPPEGMIICPAHETDIQEYAVDRGCRVGVFTTERSVALRDLRLAEAMARAGNGRIEVGSDACAADAGALDPRTAVGPQLASALADFMIRNRPGNGNSKRDAQS